MKKIVLLKLVWEDGSYVKTTDKELLAKILRMLKKQEKLENMRNNSSSLSHN